MIQSPFIQRLQRGLFRPHSRDPSGRLGLQFAFCERAKSSIQLQQMGVSRARHTQGEAVPWHDPHPLLLPCRTYLFVKIPAGNLCLGFGVKVDFGWVLLSVSWIRVVDKLCSSLPWDQTLPFPPQCPCVVWKNSCKESLKSHFIQ